MAVRGEHSSTYRIALAAMIVADERKSWMRCAEGLDDVDGLVLTAVVDNDYFTRVRLPREVFEHTAQSLGKTPFLVVSGDDDSEKWTVANGAVLRDRITNAGLFYRKKEKTQALKAWLVRGDFYFGDLHRVNEHVAGRDHPFDLQIACWRAGFEQQRLI